MLLETWAYNEFIYFFRLYLIFLFFTCILLFFNSYFYKFDLNFTIVQVKLTIYNLKFLILFLIILNCTINIFLMNLFHFFYFSYFEKEYLTPMFHNFPYLFIGNIFLTDYYNITIFSISKFNISFILLFSLLYPIIFSFISYDSNCYSDDLYLRLYYVFFLSYIILITENIILFYFSYELLLLLVYTIMIRSSNSRGAVEASLFYLGWAILGSILVGFGFLLIIIKTNNVYFFLLKNSIMSSNETYYIYLLLFFGFGIKLSVWPFWYWLPKAHVEVSTGMSIFLSCILIKLSLFALLRLQCLLLSEISFNICIFVSLLCTFDIVIRFVNLQDLKAMIAYGSVLHTNLLITLIHLDSFSIIKNSIFYIWGHSLSTTTLFIIVNLIEIRYSSRSILNITGLWYTSPLLAKLIVISLLSFLDIPLTIFFWGEIYLWEILIFSLPIISTQIIFFVLIIFISIFFKIWWNLLFGVSENNTNKLNFADLNIDINFFLLWLNLIQIILGLQPNILTFLCGFYV